VRGPYKGRPTRDGSRFRLFGRGGERELVGQPPQGQLALITALDVVAASVSTARTLTDVLGIIVDAAKRFTGTEKALICLVDEYADALSFDPSTLVVRGARDMHEEDWWGPRLAEVAEDMFADGRPFFDLDDTRNAWMLALPVRVYDHPIGILVAINGTDHALLQEHTAFLSILGTFAAASIANARLAEESQYALLASERERIAREMHDGIAQSLFSISLGMEVCKKQVYRDPAVVYERLNEMQHLLEHSMGELRRYIYDLRPAKLQELGLKGAIDYWMQQITATEDVHATIRTEGEMRSLGAETEACLYRVAREAVTNAIKHGRPSFVTVVIAYGEDAVEVRIEDDGVGFDVREAIEASDGGETVGLRSLRERLRIANGTLVIESAPGTGCRVCGRVPC